MDRDRGELRGSSTRPIHISHVEETQIDNMNSRKMGKREEKVNRSDVEIIDPGKRYEAHKICE